MFKRAFFTMVGLGAGVVLGVWAVRRVENARAKLTPGHLGGVAAAGAESLRDRLAAAVDEGRRAAAAKEAELRATYGGAMQFEPAPGAEGDPVDRDAI